MIERQPNTPHPTLYGYDALRPDIRDDTIAIPPGQRAFSPNAAYDEYYKIHKVFVGTAGGARLQEIGEQLQDEWLPGYLNTAGWAFAESALTQTNRSATRRMNLLTKADTCWQRALTTQQQLDDEHYTEWLTDETESFRLALNLAYSPLMRAIVAGDVTSATRERAFADTLAIAQLSAAQLDLADKAQDISAIGDHIGFQYECNALLSLLYLDNPNYVPLPSSARAGSGYDYREQTHDISLIHQRWGKIHKVTPIEIKAKASLQDRKRYQALIVRGKMHLSVTGKYTPRATTDAFAAIYEGHYTKEDTRIAQHASSTMQDLIVLYQKGSEVDSLKNIHSYTRYQEKDKVAEKYHELSSSPRR